MEFLVEFDVTIPDGALESEVKDRVGAEATAAAGLARQGHLVRLWRAPMPPRENKAVGLHLAYSEAELDALLGPPPARTRRRNQPRRRRNPLPRAGTFVTGETPHADGGQAGGL